MKHLGLRLIRQCKKYWAWYSVSSTLVVLLTMRYNLPAYKNQMQAHGHFANCLLDYTQTAIFSKEFQFFRCSGFAHAIFPIFSPNLFDFDLLFVTIPTVLLLQEHLHYTSNVLVLTRDSQCVACGIAPCGYWGLEEYTHCLLQQTIKTDYMDTTQINIDMKDC